MGDTNPKTLTVADVARLLGISRASVYAKIKARSLRPVPGPLPYRFYWRDILAYQQVRAANQVPSWHGRLTATQVLQQECARLAPVPVPITHLVTVLHQHDIGRTWQAPRQTCCQLLARGPFRRVHRGWYTIDRPPRSPPA